MSEFFSEVVYVCVFWNQTLEQSLSDHVHNAHNLNT